MKKSKRGADVGLRTITSSILLNKERREEFQELALYYAKNLASNYYSVSSRSTPGDVVDEVWVAILRQNKDFDPSKGKSFRGFVRMLVSNMYIDMGRAKTIKYEAGYVSLETKIVSDKGSLSIGDMVGQDDNELEAVENVEVFKDFFSLLPSYMTCGGNERELEEGKSIRSILCLENVLRLKLNGFSIKEIADFYNVRTIKITNMISNNRKILWEICNNFMGDVITMPLKP